MDLTPRTDHKDFGQVRYNEAGLPICHLCGAAHAKLMSHVYQVHDITAREYKIMFGLDVRKGIIAQSTREKLRRAFEENYDTAVQNLLTHGPKHRFKKGDRPREIFSKQSLKRLSDVNKTMGEIRKVRNTSRRIIENTKQESENNNADE